MSFEDAFLTQSKDFARSAFLTSNSGWHRMISWKEGSGVQGVRAFGVSNPGRLAGYSIHSQADRLTQRGKPTDDSAREPFQ